MKTKIYAIIVLYNTDLSTSSSYQALLNHPEIITIVCDNSTDRINRKRIVDKNGNVYLSMHGNKGLSKAYNRALDHIKEENPIMEGYVCLLDDDTEIPEDYFDQIKAAAQRKKAQIYLPLVTDSRPDQGYLSPSIMVEPYVHRTKDPFGLSQNEICGINSGMLIDLALFKTYRYNEDLFLDHVDHSFIRDMRKREAKVEILKVMLRQDFSSFQPDGEKAIQRFEILKRDLNEFYKAGIKNRLYYHYVLLRRRGSIFRQTKDWRIWLH